MRNADVFTTIDRVRSRWRVRGIALTIAAAGAAFAAAIVVGSFAIATGAAIVAVAVMWARTPSLSAVDAARLIESRSGPLDNLVVTAAELQARPRDVRPEIGDEIHRQALERIAVVDATRVVPLASPILVALAVVIGCGLLARIDKSTIQAGITARSGEQPERAGADALLVTVSPPTYTRRKTEVFENPTQITVIAGSRVRIESRGAVVRDWIATQSAALELSAASGARFLSLVVVPDTPPQLRVIAPGKDTAFAVPKGSVPITIESRDDLGLSSLTLRYTKASGGGENVAFSEGEIPLRLERTSDQQWQGAGRLSLDALELVDGDIVVYRAIARDTNPAGAPVQSDQYVIEIGKNAALVDAGFSLPAEEKKYAISQQMVIYKTEQLIAGAPKMPAEERLEQSRNIGLEQRMVRAEVVFLGGGEVQDEVEEAAHSHELAEGRLENAGRAEMLRAINFMSRAEAQLNDGRAADALVFERQALASLERALDRRRYFLRTLPGRSRIDLTRRLTGERREARSWNRDQIEQPAQDGLEASQIVMRALAFAAAYPESADAALAARVAAIDPSSRELQNAAVAIAAASTDASRRAAVDAAMNAVTAHALDRVSAATPLGLDAQPLSGAFADELARRRRQ